MADGLTVRVLCPYCATPVSIAPPKGAVPVQHLLARCAGAGGAGCARRFAVLIQCDVTYWAQTARLTFAEERECRPQEAERESPCDLR